MTVYIPGLKFRVHQAEDILVPGTLLWPSPATSALASSARAGSHDFVRGTLPTGMLSSGQRFPTRDMVRRMRKANVEAGRIWT